MPKTDMMAPDSGNNPQGLLAILKATLKDFGEDECGTRAAALAYSTIFALPPLLILIVTVAGRVWGANAVQSALEGQFSGMMGPDAAKQIHDMIAHGQQSAGGGMVGTVLGVGGLLLGATGTFLALQDALNHAWEVAPDPKRGGVKNFIFKRLLSLGMVLGLGFLVAVSLTLSAGVSSVTGSFGNGVPEAAAYAIDLGVSLGVFTLLFGLLFELLPDGKLPWKSAWTGGLATAVLFAIGKIAIGLYLGHSKPGDSFGAASAFAVILVWIYYAGMIVLLGAEFTQAWARAHGQEIVPREGAIRVVRIEQKGDATAVTSSSPTLSAQRKAPAKSLSIRDWALAIPLVYWLFRSKKQDDKP